MIKKIFAPFLFVMLCYGYTQAQNIVNNVPSNASLVIKYAGNNLLQKVPIAKFDTYKLVKENLYKELGLNSNSSLGDLGIAFQQDAYQYIITTDSSSTFVSLFSIQDAAKFEKYLKTNNKNKLTIIQKNGYKLYPISAHATIGWSGNLAIITWVNYNDNSYYPYSYENNVVDAVNYAAEDAIDSATIAVEPVETSVMDTAAIIALQDTTTKTKIEPVAIAEKETDSVKKARLEKEKIEDEKREKFYADQKIREAKVRKDLAELIIDNTFSNKLISIANKPSFVKAIDNVAVVSMWMDSVSFFNKLTGLRNSYSYFNDFYNFPGYVQGANLYFENDKIRVESQVASGSENTKQLFKKIYNTKQNTSFANAISANDMGFMSISLNTEESINYYYTVARQMLSKLYGKYDKDKHDYNALIDAYMDILEIVIDEKAIAKMLPGNAMIILHDLKEKKVDYITYDYDKNYNSKKVTRSKTEISPDFSFYFETQNEKIFNKLAELPIKFNDTSYDYKKTGNFYTLTFEKNSVLDKLYFRVFEGKCIITTSLADVSKPFPTNASSLDASTMQNILNNNYSLKFDFNKLVNSLSSQVITTRNRQSLAYLQKNTGNATINSFIKDDEIHTTAIYNIKGKHKNSFEYIFNVLESLFQIQQTDKIKDK